MNILEVHIGFNGLILHNLKYEKSIVELIYIHPQKSLAEF